MSKAASKVDSPVASIASNPFKVPVPVKAMVLIFKVPVVPLSAKLNKVFTPSVMLNDPAAIANESDQKVKDGSVAPASNVQVTAEPDPNVVVPISVVSKFSVNVSTALVIVSIPFAPPTILAVLPLDID